MIEAADRVLPVTAAVSDSGVLAIGGMPVTELAREFGTPLYIYDEATLRANMRRYVNALNAGYPDALPLYASKAYSDPHVVKIAAEEGMGLDVVSAGEIAVGVAAGFPLDRMYFHGNNKLPDELAYALEVGVGRIVVDNFNEIDLLNTIAGEAGKQARILLRIGPGVEAHTHEYIKTGALDSKFGFALPIGQAEEAVKRAQAAPHLDLIGLHAHIGSQIFDIEPYVDTLDLLIQFAKEMADTYGLNLTELSPGGGWGIRYTGADDPPPIEDLAETVTATVKDRMAALGWELPRLVVEPGRSIVGQAGVGLYSVGSSKTIPGVRKYVAVDGGMADNIRPALYDALYTVLVGNRMHDPAEETVTIAGRYCESGDVLFKDIEMPVLNPGDLIAVPSSGAYCLAMSSNYNLVPRPAVVLVNDGDARLIRRRETLDDLIQPHLDV